MVLIMANSVNLPTSFSAFKSKRKSANDGDTRKQLYRFAYRYRLAKSFEGMKASNVGKTLAGYDAILKVFLAYTAYEVLNKTAKSLNVKITSASAKSDEKLVERLRKNDKLKKYIVESNTEYWLKEKIDLTLNGNSNDIAPICSALRHIFAHGELTPSPIGITTKGECKLLFDLADALLTYCDNIFTECTNHINSKNKKPTVTFKKIRRIEVQPA